MKTTLSTLFLSCFLAVQASAQLQVVNASGTVLTSPVTVNGAANPTSLPAPATPVGVAVKTTLRVKNTNANATKIRATLTRVTTADGHQNNYFCWGTNCFTSATTTSPNSVSLASGATTSDNDACIVYLSGSQNDTSPRYGGNSSFDYTFFEVNDAGTAINPANNVTIRVNFVISGTTPVEDLGVNGVRFAPIFPNPTVGKCFIQAEGIENARQTSLEIFTPQGKTITVLPLTNWQNKQHEVALPALARGMYLYRFGVDGKQSRIGKLLIAD